MLEKGGFRSAGQEGSVGGGVAEAPGSFHARGYMTKGMDENHDQLGRLTEERPEMGYDRSLSSVLSVLINLFVKSEGW